MYSLHATKKLRDRAELPVLAAVADPTTWLGRNWSHGPLLASSQLVLLVNERTLFPVLMPRRRPRTVLDRFPIALGETLAAAGVESQFIDAELAEMNDRRWAKTASRSVLGIMNEFTFLASDSRHRHDFDPIGLALWLAQTPCGPLYGRYVSPDRELAASVGLWVAERNR